MCLSFILKIKQIGDIILCYLSVRKARGLNAFMQKGTFHPYYVYWLTVVYSCPEMSSAYI